MKYVLLLFLSTTVLYSQSSDSLKTINGSVWFSTSYCKGTPPEKEVYIGHPYKGVTFYVVQPISGKLVGKKVASFTSDENGLFSFVVPKGDYNIVINYPNYYLYSNEYGFSSEIVWTQGPEFKFNTEINSFIQLSFYQPCPPGPDRM